MMETRLGLRWQEGSLVCRVALIGFVDWASHYQCCVTGHCCCDSIIRVLSPLVVNRGLRINSTHPSCTGIVQAVPLPYDGNS